MRPFLLGFILFTLSLVYMGFSVTGFICLGAVVIILAGIAQFDYECDEAAKERKVRVE